MHAAGPPSPLQALLTERILVLDGAMGTMLQQEHLSADDFGGEQYEGCNEYLVVTRPALIERIHRAYLDAGADIIATNTFGGTPLVLGEYGLQDEALSLNMQAAALARRAVEACSTAAWPRFVGGSIGPTTKSITITGGVAFDALIDHFRVQTVGLLRGGVDLLFLETCQDTRNIKAATIGIAEAFAETTRHVPLIISATIEPMGTMLAGQDTEALAVALEHLPLLAIGLNCATGPEFMTDHLRTLHEMSATAISCYPNAGLPDEHGTYPETPTSLAEKLARFAEHGWLNFVGGCCGTTPEHIRAIAQMAREYAPRIRPTARPSRTFFSGLEAVEATDATRPLIVGERTNVIGSKRFKHCIAEGQWEEAAEIARAQIAGGAHIVDVCLQSADLDEEHAIDPFYDRLIRLIKVPVMIDTTDPAAVEKALTYLQGKSIINSVNLEDGEEKFQTIAPLVRRYGAAVIVGCIDEDPTQAQAFTRERKLDIARRSCALLTQRYGIAPHNIIFDPLVFPCATGDESYIGGAVETIEGIRLIKAALPHCKTILGISNVSFGLPISAREIVNSVFLYHCTKAGLDLAIVNAERLARFADIPATERLLAECLLFNHAPASITDPDAERDWRKETPEQRTMIHQRTITDIAEYFRGHTGEARTSRREDLPLDERLAAYIVHGTKSGLHADLDLKRGEGTGALEIINGPLMAGMAEVGRLFNDNALIVAEVLQSAEVMKAAVDHLEPYMEKNTALEKATIILATVKGDVHDIGKNLVEIILKNNGFRVVNLGIKVPPDHIIQACQTHRPDLIGLSGLLVKSAHQMVTTAADLQAAGITVPVLVGGAALSDRFTKTKIAPEYVHGVFYANDAMQGLDIANKLIHPQHRKRLFAQQNAATVVDEGQASTRSPDTESRQRSATVRVDLPLPQVPDCNRHVEDLTSRMEEIWGLINPQMLYAKHLGLRGNFEKKIAERDEKALHLQEAVNAVKARARPFMTVKGVWQFFQATSEGNTMHLHHQGSSSPYPFTFPRQRKKAGLSLADYVLPQQAGLRDHVALFAVTAGHGIRPQSTDWKDRGEYVHAHILQVLALETAEAAAEWVHREIRSLWGFADDQSLKPADLFQAKYRGKRYSFGYPACPNLDDQAGLWQLIDPTSIGIELTDGFMMDPEASVSAIVFHHPDCRYFSTEVS